MLLLNSICPPLYFGCFFFNNGGNDSGVHCLMLEAMEKAYGSGFEHRGKAGLEAFLVAVACLNLPLPAPD